MKSKKGNGLGIKTKIEYVYILPYKETDDVKS